MPFTVVRLRTSGTGTQWEQTPATILTNDTAKRINNRFWIFVHRKDRRGAAVASTLGYYRPHREFGQTSAGNLP
jgi:hypothetical protein